MKKISYLITVALAILMASCSASDIVGSTDDKAPSSATDFTNSDVKILLASKTAAVGSNVTESAKTTRAIINSDDNLCFNAKGIGIFCLATRQMANGSNLSIDWSRYVANGYSIWLNNVAADAVIKQDINSNEYTDITWEDNKARYYPTGNAHAYSFYGLYPRSTTLNYSQDSITATVAVDGHTDILYGKAENLTDNYAYSAKYFRANPALDGTAEMTFNHLLMGLTFNIIAGADTTYDSSTQTEVQSYTKALNTYVDSIEIENVPTALKVNIANKADKSHEGISFRDESTTSTANMYIRNADGTAFTPVAPATTGTAIGDTLLVPVPSSDTYYMKVHLAYHTKTSAGADTIVYMNSPVTIPLTLKKGVSFQQGHYYVVHLTVYGPQEIKLNAKLNAWSKEDDAFITTTGEVD